MGWVYVGLVQVDLAWSKFGVTKQSSNTLLHWICLKTSGPVSENSPCQCLIDPNRWGTSPSGNRVPIWKFHCCIGANKYQNNIIPKRASSSTRNEACWSDVLHVYSFFACFQYSARVGICCQLRVSMRDFYAQDATKNGKHGLRLVLQKGQPKDLRLKFTNPNKNKLCRKTTTKDISGLSDFRQELLENKMMFI